MTIHNKKAFDENLWDWEFTRKCLGGGKIVPTDVDGLVERCGRFLVLEAKSPGVVIKEGQEYTFNSLLATGFFTVIVIWGKPQEPEHIQIWGKTSKIPCQSLDDLGKVIAKWYQWACKQPKLEPINNQFLDTF